MPNSDTQDEVLLNLDESVLSSLIDNQRAFKQFLVKRLANEAVADELLQQSLLKAIENQDSLNKNESVIPWFYRILRNTLIDYYRAHATESKKYTKYMNELGTSIDDHSPSLDELKAEVCACFVRLLPTLKPSYAEVIKKIDLGERPISEVALEEGVTPNNLMVRLHRARQALKTSLTRSCGACSVHGCLDCTCE